MINVYCRLLTVGNATAMLNFTLSVKGIPLGGDCISTKPMISSAIGSEIYRKYSGHGDWPAASAIN